MNNLEVIKIWKAYSDTEFLKSLLMGLITYLLIGGILVTPIVVMSMLYVPFMTYFLLAIHIVLAFAGYYGFGLMTETLQNYQKLDHINYKTFQTRAAVTLATIVLIVLSLVYLLYLE